MLGFFTLYLLLYGGLHLHFYVKLQSALHLHGVMLLPLILWLVTMFLAPIAVWRLESIGLHLLVKPVAFIGYCWMGLLFLFFSLALTLELAQMVLKGAATLFFFLPPPLLVSAKALFFTALFTAAAAAGWGFVAARSFNVEQVALALPALPPAAEGYRIVQISDIHLGVMTDRRWLEEMVATVNGLQPDLIVATGDVVDSHVDGSQVFAAVMQRLQARDGSYAIPGNHEQYAGIERSLRFLREAGFTPLRDEIAHPQPWLTLVGVDDHSRHGPQQQNRPDQELPLLQQARREGRVVVLLKHQPLVAAASVGLFNLQLSGHVHQGQIYPFRYLTRLIYQIDSGLNSVGQGSWLYLNRGTGTWGPPMRVLAPPEITLIELHHATHSVAGAI